ncbi:PREDICTED: uncharacterized protein LOC105448078 [Wasmannia auropunctata]|uniref:uncharacterized protein LOC105448078 n=1 Tax=Wasmannia auropunctata TaxID=64793 RepID=UPI0005ED58C1|nr:PREDICTED: uncharacterized protein LOC105448078 [Wasmannia auropunctata]
MLISKVDNPPELWPEYAVIIRGEAKEDVDYEGLICLEAKDLLQLFPKAGPRVKFCKKLEAHKLAELEVTFIPQTLSFDENKIEAIAISNIKEIESSDYSLPINSDCDNIENVPSCSNAQEEFIQPKATSVRDQQQQTVNEILQLTEKDLDAKAAYNILIDPNEKKKDAAKAKLCAAIVKYELTNNSLMRIQQQRLQKLAEQIQECIPGEVKETYYVPYQKLFNKKVNAKGKLYDRYTNYLRSLRIHGLTHGSTEVTNKTNESSSVVSENITGQLEWLRTHKEPFEDVKERWEATYDIRVQMLRTSTRFMIT